ncbi:MAG: hypothetical protein NVS4B11_21870 [Ktedonobacteraceae bacterium]
MGAVQSQNFAAAKWAVGLRMHDVTNNDIEQAFTDGAILRTHVMRPTSRTLPVERERLVKASLSCPDSGSDTYVGCE